MAAPLTGSFLAFGGEGPFSAILPASPEDPVCPPCTSFPLIGRRKVGIGYECHRDGKHERG
jgi:hypothetical protein